jgi:branched-chain amino acid transport system substrate-binding protein
MASSKILNEKRIPAIALAPAQEVANPVSDRRYVFKLAPNPQDGAAALATELHRANARSVGVLSTEDEYGADGEEALRRELEKLGIKRTTTARFKPADTDLSQPVARVIADKPEALVLWAYPTQAGIAAVSARAAGFEGRLYLDAAAAGELFLSGPTAAATENAIMISTQTMAIDDVIATTPAKAARKQWFRDYTSRYGGYFGYASFAADAVQMIVNAIEVTHGTTRDRIRDAIETAQLDGLSGPIRITPDNHSGLMPQALTVLVARSGRWRLSS